VRRNCLYCARCYASCPREGPRARSQAGDLVRVEDVK
jgi:hypothetical protein